MKEFLVLVINPGSTSTKIAVFRNKQQIHSETLRHAHQELAQFDGIIDQFAYRQKVIMESVEKAGYKMADFDAIVGRGGLLRPITGGTYDINEAMIEDLKNKKRGDHASNLGALIARSLAREYGIPSFIVDPVSVDELLPIARFSGMPEAPRESLFHALNQKAVARVAAADLNKAYEAIELIVVHLGGGISVAAHSKGRIIDVNNVIMGEGPFSPERAGTVPVGKLVELCFSGKYTEKEIKKKLMGQGGLAAYLGTTDAQEVEKRIEMGDVIAQEIYEAMAYQIAKEIGAASAVLKGKVDLIAITGGLAYSKMLMDWIVERVRHIAPVKLYPGEMEMQALAEGGLRVLEGREKVKEYLNDDMGEIPHVVNERKTRRSNTRKARNLIVRSAMLNKSKLKNR